MKKILGKLLLVLLLTLSILPFSNVRENNVSANALVTNSSDQLDVPLDWLPTLANENEKVVRIIVELEDNANRQQVKEQVLKLSESEVKREFTNVLNGFSVEIQSDRVPFLQTIEGVKNVTLSKLYYPTDTSANAIIEARKASQKYANNGEGVVVAIVDTGVDIEHPAFQEIDAENVKISQAEVDAFVNDLKAQGYGEDETLFNLKVPYGYNFADNSYKVKSTNSNHGVHVAGIVGANDSAEKVEALQGVEGVASQVQLLAMKVFSNYSSGAYDDDIVAAIEDSIAHKADIINLSLGSASGFTDGDAMQKAINKAQEQGVLVVVAGGNDYGAFSTSNSGANIETLLNYDDQGLVGSPSTASGALSVASYENNLVLRYLVTLNNEEKFALNVAQGTLEGEYEIVSAGIGNENEFTVDVKDKVVLIQRGTITFAEKANNAIAKGAKAVLIYNNTAGDISMAMTGVSDVNFFAASLSQADGEKILEAIKKGNAKVSFAGKLEYAENIERDHMSVFSSIGSTSTLDFKPEVTGVGGNVYSTDNTNGDGVGKYTTMSGTSMASPLVAGGSAIVLSQLKKDLPGIDNYAVFIKKTLINTATVITNPEENHIPYSVRRQGSGLVNINAAVENRVLATITDANGDAVGALKAFEGVKEFTINLHNYDKYSVMYSVDAGKVYTTVNNDKNEVTEFESKATITTDKKYISISPGQDVQVKVTIDATGVVNEFVEGFITFTPAKGSDIPSIHFPYMGYAGDWNNESIFDSKDVLENYGTENEPFYGQTSLYSVLQYSETISSNIQLGVQHDSDGIAVEDSYAFSPNGDGYAEFAYPVIGFLRSAKTVDINILDSKGNNVRDIIVYDNVRRNTVLEYLDAYENGDAFLVTELSDAAWDGKLYNKSTGQMEVAKDGTYYYQLVASLGEGFGTQELKFKLKVDSTKPNISVKLHDGKDVELTPQGRKVTFIVNDRSNYVALYVKVNEDDRYPATLVDGTRNTYEVTVPYSTQDVESMTIYATDVAYNEASLKLKDLGENHVETTYETFVYEQTTDEKQGSLTGKTTLETAKKVKAVFTQTTDDFTNTVINDKNPAKVVETSEVEVNDGAFDVKFKLDVQSYYNVKFIFSDENGNVVEEVNADRVLYDYEAPKVVFYDLQEKVETPKNKENLEEYKVFETADKEIYGYIEDNLITGNPLLFGISTDATEDFYLTSSGVFVLYDVPDLTGDKTYYTVTAEQYNSKKEAKLTSKVAFSEIQKEVVTPVEGGGDDDYSGSSGKWFPDLIINSYDFVGKGAEGLKYENGKYYFEVYGAINDNTYKVLVNNQEVPQETYEDMIPGMLYYFATYVEVKQDLNSIGIRVLDKDGNFVTESKKRVWLDTNLPTISLEAPTINFTSVVDGNVVIETDESKVTFKGEIKDAGFGFELYINGDFVTGASLDFFKAEDAKFEKTIDVKDGDRVTLELKGITSQTSFSQTFVVKKVEREFTDIIEEGENPTAHLEEIKWLSNTGISTGWKLQDGTFEFKPYANLTRSQMAAFLYRYAKQTPLLNTNADEVYASKQVSFSDISDYAKDLNDLYYGMVWMADTSISTGYNNGEVFKPNDNLTRADLAAFLYRFAKQLGLVSDQDSFENSFVDVKESEWKDANGNVLDHYKGIAWMASTGISKGWDTNSGKLFKPYDKIARGDMAAFLSRLNDLVLQAGISTDLTYAEQIVTLPEIEKLTAVNKYELTEDELASLKDAIIAAEPAVFTGIIDTITLVDEFVTVIFIDGSTISQDVADFFN